MRLPITPFVVAFLLCIPAGVANDASQLLSGSTVLVEIDGMKVTAADLDRSNPGALYQARNTYYQAQKQAIDTFVQQYLLERQAKTENITVDELLERHVNRAVPADPPEEMLRLYYEVVNTPEPYDKVRAQLIDHLRKVRIARTKDNYLKSLYNSAKITVGLQAPRAEISLKNAPILGPANAPVVLIEYADYECPYCQQVQPALDKIIKEYKGKVAFAFKDSPLPMHANAQKAAEAARCAESQGKFWEYHSMLFEKKQLDLPQLKEYARALKLDGATFDQCLDSGSRAQVVGEQLREAQALGVQGTPTFFVNGRSSFGNLSYEQFRQMIDEELAHAPKQEVAGQ